VDGGADAGHDPTPQQSRHLGWRRPVDRRALAGRHQRLVGERPDAERRRQRRPVGQRHLLGGVVGGEAQVVPAAAAGPALTAHGPPVEDDVVARADVGDAVAHRLDQAGGLVAQQEREVVVDAALAVVEVGVAHAARLHGHQRLARAGIGHDDRLDRHRLALAPRDHPAYLVRHRVPLVGPLRLRP